MISVESSGSFKNFEAFAAKMSKADLYSGLDALGREGVAVLKSATPAESGETAAGWDYEIRSTRGSYSIVWVNRHRPNGFPVAIMLQYGHGTGTGGYVQGRDYINPAIRPIFDRIADRAWKVVTSA